jgi:hypothetical protein
MSQTVAAIRDRRAFHPCRRGAHLAVAVTLTESLE